MTLYLYVLLSSSLFCYQTRLWVVRERLGVRKHLQQAALVSAKLCVLYAICFGLIRFDNNLVFIATCIPVIVVWALYMVVDFVAQLYFGLSLYRIFMHLPVKMSDKGSGAAAAAYFKQYVPTKFVLTLSCAAIFSSVVLKDALPADFVAVSSICSAAIAMLVYSGSSLGRGSAEPTSIETAYLKIEDELAAERLYGSDRAAIAVNGSQIASSGKHIVLIINESAGADVPAALSSTHSLARQISELSGNASEWFHPNNALTASSCTDISIPCILTGCGPHESMDQLHRLPMVFDLAKARGLRTLMFTSSSLRWGGFESFFNSQSIDTLYSADTDGMEFVNDMCGDDYLVAKQLHTAILETDEPLCIVVYQNALHIPFQNQSACAIPDGIKDRRKRASYVIEASHGLIFDALKKTGRYDDSLIVSVGDHGETMGVDGSDETSRFSRLTNLSEPVVRPLYAIKPPRGLPERELGVLRANMDSLISTIDIAPTVAGLLNLTLPETLSYAGFNLFEPVPADRVHYTLTVNEWRSWPRAAVMLAQGNNCICIDYQNSDILCTDTHGKPLHGEVLRLKETLLKGSLSEPIVQKSISRVFRDKLSVSSAFVSPIAKKLLVISRETEIGPFSRFYGHNVLASDQTEGRLHYQGNDHTSEGFGLDPKSTGIVLHGPYITLEPGRYRAAFVFKPGTLLGSIGVDVVDGDTQILSVVKISQLDDNLEAEVCFELNSRQSRIEVRLFNFADSFGFCTGLKLVMIKEI
jgi:hypothetical protein